MIAIGAVAYLTYQKFSAAKGATSALNPTGPSSSVGPGASAPVVAPDWGVDSSGGWDSTMSVSSLTDLIGGIL
jgi:hypothetical protein